MITFNDLKFQTLDAGKGLTLKRAEAYFDNGLGISVIEFTYEDGIKYEVAVLKHKNLDRKSVDFTNLFGGPIIPRLTIEGVNNKLYEIQEHMNHGTINRETEKRSKRPLKQSSGEGQKHTHDRC